MQGVLHAFFTAGLLEAKTFSGGATRHENPNAFGRTLDRDGRLCVKHIAEPSALLVIQVVFRRMLNFSQFDFGQFDFGQLAEIEQAKVEIGRSRNWPKLKLAELEISWPKSIALVFRMPPGTY